MGCESCERHEKRYELLEGKLQLQSNEAKADNTKLAKNCNALRKQVNDLLHEVNRLTGLLNG